MPWWPRPARTYAAAVAAEDGPFHGADPASLQLAGDASHGPDGASEPLAKALSRAAPGVIEAYAGEPNAVSHATGVRVRKLPIRLEKLLDAPTLQT